MTEVAVIREQLPGLPQELPDEIATCDYPISE